MKPISRRKALAGGVALAAAAGASGTALANGDEFFGAEEIPGETQFVFFGSVKDEQGKYLDGVEVVLDVLDPPLTYIAYTDVIGRFRTLDAGRVMVDLGYDIDPSKLKLSVSLPGYVQTRRLSRVPTRAVKGAFEINFVMKQLDEAKK